MIIDEPSLCNSERIHLAADAVESGYTCIVYIQPRGLADKGDAEEMYRNWVAAVLRERNHSVEGAEILASGVIVILENMECV